jgi:hypothetical protein
MNNVMFNLCSSRHTVERTPDEPRMYDVTSVL